MQGKKKFLAPAALTASLIIGGLVGAMFGTPAVSFAQTEPDQRVERAERPGDGRGRGETRSADRPAAAGDERSAQEDSDGDRRGRHAHRGVALQAAAEALGMRAEELKAELRNGKSVRTVAEERGVDVQTVIDAIVAAVTEHAEERATEFVNRERPAGGPEEEGRRRPRREA